MKIKVNDEEKCLRKKLGLPITKELRYMRNIGCQYEEVKVIDFKIVDVYEPSETPPLVVSLETGESIRILSSFFAEMQKPSFEQDMKILSEGERNK